ncbi:hypothetical protein EAM01S_09_00690 [Erwinia amylovora NBRC 12687 = CFBP 1232]|nr:hypothetical protein EAM01S_09_00690 [Erwinia amylovora NBRC 12687 = CFBP 1232]
MTRINLHILVTKGNIPGDKRRIKIRVAIADGQSSNARANANKAVLTFLIAKSSILRVNFHIDACGNGLC